VRTELDQLRKLFISLGNQQEGRIEVKSSTHGWGLVCGDGWSLLEAMVVCRQLNYGYAQSALSSSFFGGNIGTRTVLSGVKCKGNERNLADCNLNQIGSVTCPGSGDNIAGVICTSGKSISYTRSLVNSNHLFNLN